MSLTPLAVTLCGGPFCGAAGVVAMQAAEMDTYLIRDAVTHQVHAYRWTGRTEAVDGVPVGWVLSYVCPVGAPPVVVPGAPLLPGVAEFLGPEVGKEAE
jgi:hypothetical protein